MGRAKDIVVKPIAAKDARRIIKSLHYSGKVVQNSQIHFGVFLDGKCGGALQFGPSLDKRKMLSLVRGTKWNEFLELNRMALADWLPRNSESRSISVAIRLLRKPCPWVKWVVSFADATQCGDGGIYRASGFVLTDVRANRNSSLLSDGTTIHKMTVQSSPLQKWPWADNRSWVDVMGGGMGSWATFCDRVGAKVLTGFQLRYIYFLDPTARDRLTVPIIPFSEIDHRGAGMYRGKPCAGSADSGTPPIQGGGGGANPTSALTKQEDGDRVPGGE